jgi:hypothetical protein
MSLSRRGESHCKARGGGHEEGFDRPRLVYVTGIDTVPMRTFPSLTHRIESIAHVSHGYAQFSHTHPPLAVFMDRLSF